MAKIPVKKKTAKKISKPAAKKSAKKTVRSKPAAAKKIVVKKPVTDKERELREANLIANLENKKKTPGAKRPKKASSPKQTSTLLDAIVEGMQERKARNVVILNLSEIENRVTDFFVICDADSNTHVNSIADSVEDTVIKLTNEKAYHSEGR